jgi:hypothetical protein
MKQNSPMSQKARPRRIQFSRFLLLLGICSWLSGGACANGASYDSGVFQTKQVRYRIEGPSQKSWREVAIDSADIAWYHNPSGATLMANSHCEGVDDAPLEALTQHLLLGTTERRILSQEKKPFSNREALDTRAEAKLDGVLTSMRLFVLKKDGCVYDLVLTSPPEAFENANGAFSRVLENYEVESRPNRPEDA